MRLITSTILIDLIIEKCLDIRQVAMLYRNRFKRFPPNFNGVSVCSLADADQYISIEIDGKSKVIHYGRKTLEASDVDKVAERIDWIQRFAGFSVFVRDLMDHETTQDNLEKLLKDTVV
jgi:hypothetical protein